MEENEAVSAKIQLPDTVLTYLDTCIEGYGLDAITQGLRDLCAKRANNTTRLPSEQKREARLWGFGRNAYDRCLRSIVDHGPGSGC